MGRKNRKLERTGMLECQISWWGHNLKNYHCTIVFPFLVFHKDYICHRNVSQLVHNTAENETLLC